MNLLGYIMQWHTGSILLNHFFKQCVQCVYIYAHCFLVICFIIIFMESKLHLTMFLGLSPLVARFMWPTWDPSGADRTQVGPMLAPRTLLSGSLSPRQSNNVEEKWRWQNFNKVMIKQLWWLIYFDIHMKILYVSFCISRHFIHKDGLYGIVDN